MSQKRDKSSHFDFLFPIFFLLVLAALALLFLVAIPAQDRREKALANEWRAKVTELIQKETASAAHDTTLLILNDHLYIVVNGRFGCDEVWTYTANYDTAKDVDGPWYKEYPRFKKR